MFLQPTDPGEINSTIKKLKPKKSAGPENISSWLLKELNDSISEPLALIINKSITQGVFPEKFKLPNYSHI